MTRSRIGPLALESPLGDANGSVFRAIHVQQRMQVAVRVFSTPMGMTPEAKRSFADEMESLKNLKHPGIVRCFGGGFDNRDAYLVYELIDGDSLESILGRRERLAWNRSWTTAYNFPRPCSSPTIEVGSTVEFAPTRFF